MRALLATGLAALLLLAGCDSSDHADDVASTASGSPTYRAPLLTQDGELLLSCGRPDETFPASVMHDGLPWVLTDGEARATFTALLADPRFDDILRMTFLTKGARTRWRLLRVDGDRYTFGLGRWYPAGPGPGATVMNVVRVGEGWEMRESGDCRLAPAIEPDTTFLELTEPRDGLDRESTTLTVGVTEMACTGGRDPIPHLREPVVVESDDAVTVFWTTRSMSGRGGATCIGPRPSDATLQLDHPLGDRQLLDGSTYPARPVGPSSLLLPLPGDSPPG
jgi:hypothetical protein